MTIDTFKKIDIELTTQRLKKEFDVSSNRALSLAMGLSQSTFINAMKRSSLPYEGIIKACIAKSISLDDIFGIKQTFTISHQNESNLANSYKTIKKEVTHLNNLVESVIDETIAFNELTGERSLSVRKSLRPILVEAALEYECDHTIVQAIAKSTLSLL